MKELKQIPNSSERAGYLHSRQTLQVEGPPLSSEAWNQLPERMVGLHFAGIRTSALGTLSCSQTADGFDCRFFGRWPGLSFHRVERDVDDRRIRLQWILGPGMLARSKEERNGTLTLGAERSPLCEEREAWTLWAEVEGYPSRFLPLSPGRPLYLIHHFIGKVYVAYHSWVTMRYLRQLARLIQRGEV